MEDESSNRYLTLLKLLYDKQEVARMIGISRSTLNIELKKLGLFKKDKKLSAGDLSNLLTALNIPNRIDHSKIR